MSTNKTTNYALHSWLPTDEFHLTEINENFTLLDAALKAEAGQHQTLAAAIGERLRIATGSYVGVEASNSDTPQRIKLGLKPKALLLAMDRGFVDLDSYPYGGLITETCDMYGAVVMDDAGFTVRNIYNHSVRVNSKTKNYHYMVFY